MCGAHVVREVRQHRWEALFCLTVRRVVLQHHDEWLSVAAGRFEVHQLVPGCIVRLSVYVAPLHPNDVHVPALGDLVDEDQRFLALLAGVLEEQVHVWWQSPAMGFENFLDHVGAGAATTDADLGRARDRIGIHNCSRQPIASPPGVIR